MDGVNGGTGDGAVSDNGIAQRCLVVLIVEEFLGEDLFESEPCPRYVRWKFGFPVIKRLVHV